MNNLSPLAGRFGLSLAGGSLVLSAHGAGKFSVDGWQAARRAKGVAL